MKNENQITKALFNRNRTSQLPNEYMHTNIGIYGKGTCVLKQALNLESRYTERGEKSEAVAIL